MGKHTEPHGSSADCPSVGCLEVRHLDSAQQQPQISAAAEQHTGRMGQAQEHWVPALKPATLRDLGPSSFLILPGPRSMGPPAGKHRK